ncbi:MAG: hypothetical protein KKB20_28150 [Proteobacteria bacterium]|nr:hypothetical protein [Pseudomonadota bacterium]
MACEWPIVGPQGLRFCEKITASISHDFKNMLAIINESAGLLGDLIVMSEGGRPLDLGRVKTVADRITKQVLRADKLVKHMNQFAHSYGDPVKSLNLNELLDMMSALALRLSSMAGVTLVPPPPGSPAVAVTTWPFFLEHMVWRCLELAMGAAGAGKEVGLEAETTGTGARIRFTRLAGLAEASLDGFPGIGGQALLDALEADVRVDAEAGEIVLSLPQKIEA